MYETWSVRACVVFEENWNLSSTFFVKRPLQPGVYSGRCRWRCFRQVYLNDEQKNQRVNEWIDYFLCT
jgi:hypothetical protein